MSNFREGGPATPEQRQWVEHGILSLEHHANGTMEKLPPAPGRDVHLHAPTDVCVSCDIAITGRWDSELPGPETEET